MTINEAVMKRLGEIVDKESLKSPKRAAEAGIPESTMKNINRQKTRSITLKTLYVICEGLKISVTDFLDSEYFDRDNLEGIKRGGVPEEDPAPEEPEIRDRNVADAVTARIEYLVKEKKMTKREVSKAGHISEGSIANLHKCSSKGLTLTTLLAICNGLKMTMAEFLDCEYLKPEHLTDI